MAIHIVIPIITLFKAIPPALQVTIVLAIIGFVLLFLSISIYGRDDHKNSFFIFGVLCCGFAFVFFMIFLILSISDQVVAAAPDNWRNITCPVVIEVK